MDALVTGGAGFIGSHLCRRLLDEGHAVTAVDNLHTGSLRNIQAFRDRSSFRFVQASAGALPALKIPKADIIFHNGIYSSSPIYKENPRRVAEAIDDFLVLLEHIRKSDSALVLASSSSLYNGIVPPHREDMPITVSDYYTEARFAMERLAELYHKLYAVNIVALRYFSVYGPGEESKGRYANLVSQFLWALLKNEPPVIFGDGTQTRDFTHVDDVVRANLLAAKFPVRSGVFNVGTGRSVSINDMAGIVQSKSGKKIAPAYVPNTIQNYVAHTQADTSRAEEKLGFRSSIPLEQGVTQLVAQHILR